MAGMVWQIPMHLLGVVALLILRVSVVGGVMEEVVTEEEAGGGHLRGLQGSGLVAAMRNERRPCFVEAYMQLEGGCRDLVRNEEEACKMAVRLANCDLDAAGLESSTCGAEMSCLQCLSSMGVEEKSYFSTRKRPTTAFAVFEQWRSSSLIICEHISQYTIRHKLEEAQIVAAAYLEDLSSHMRKHIADVQVSSMKATESFLSLHRSLDVVQAKQTSQLEAVSQLHESLGKELEHLQSGITVNNQMVETASQLLLASIQQAQNEAESSMRALTSAHGSLTDKIAPILSFIETRFAEVDFALLSKTVAETFDAVLDASTRLQNLQQNSRLVLMSAHIASIWLFFLLLGNSLANLHRAVVPLQSFTTWTRYLINVEMAVFLAMESSMFLAMAVMDDGSHKSELSAFSVRVRVGAASSFCVTFLVGTLVAIAMSCFSYIFTIVKIVLPRTLGSSIAPSVSHIERLEMEVLAALPTPRDKCDFDFDGEDEGKDTKSWLLRMGVRSRRNPPKYSSSYNALKQQLDEELDEIVLSRRAVVSSTAWRGIRDQKRCYATPPSPIIDSPITPLQETHMSGFVKMKSDTDTFT